MKERGREELDLTPFMGIANSFIGNMEAKGIKIKRDITLSLVNLSRSGAEPTQIVTNIRDSLKRDKKDDKFFLLLAKTEESLQKGKLVIQSLCTEAGFKGIDENGEVLINPREKAPFACGRFPLFRGRSVIVYPCKVEQ